MDVTALTQQASTNGNGKHIAAGHAPLGTGMFGAVPGASFMDLIFAHISANAETGTAAATGVGTENNELITSQPEPLSLQSSLEDGLTDPDGLPTPDIGELTPENLANETLINEAPINETLVNPPVTDGEASKTLKDFLSSLIAGLPQENKVITLDIAPGQIKKLFGKLQGGEDSSSPALIATGLTPEKITELLRNLANGDEQGEGFVIGMIKILPPQAKKAAIFMPRGIVIVPPQQQATEAPTTPQATGETSTKTSSLINNGGASEFPLEEGDFEGVLRVLERAQNKTLERGKENSGLEKAINNIKRLSAGLSAVQGTPPALAQIFTSFAVDSIYPEGMDFSGAPGQSMTLTGAAQFTSMIGQAPLAGQPHPATQLIATTIAKATTNGEAKNITIQLDPPDLGKVRVSIDFNNEKGTMKAMIVAEKPETFLMLQRDAQMLERSLLDAGLDVDSGGLGFELSQDGSEFNNENKGQGGGSGSNDNGADTADAANEDIEIIEATMDWYTDPNTGLMRYSALV